MSQAAAFIERLSNDRIVGPGERARLRALCGRGLDASTPGFDLFAGLWWPLRQKNQSAPRREVAWLIAKLFAAFPLPHAPEPPANLPAILGRCEPVDDHGRPRFRRRFDVLLCSPLGQLEPHLRWALSVARAEIVARRVTGLDWVKLTDHLSIWDRGAEHRLERDIRDLWAEQYLNATRTPTKGDFHAD